MTSVVRIDVISGDVFAHETDVLALKYAQALYGVDRKVVEQLDGSGINIRAHLPRIGTALLCDSGGVVRAAQILFLGVPPLGRFGYGQIRQFSRGVLRELSLRSAGTRYVALTLHGRGFGLDEIESFKAEVAGLLDALEAHEHPHSLEVVTIVERDKDTAKRLANVLDELIPARRVISGPSTKRDAGAFAARDALRDVGDRSEMKSHVFVAMPFAPEFDDRFHYGIKNAVNAAGHLCERVDLSTFTGDVLARIHDRIANAALVIADLSNANPNVYLEVGYAWGKGVRTVLVAAHGSDLLFDVRGQRCLMFKSIQNLEELLTRELRELLR